MAQVEKGVRSILAVPSVYNLFQTMVGAPAARKKLVRDHIRPAPGERILDVGCGPGEILDDLPEVVYVGSDLSEAYIAQAEARYGDRGKFFAGDVYAIEEFEPNSFDTVMAIALVHHLDDDEAMKLYEFAKDLLKPGGRLITSDPVYTQEQSRLARYLISRDRGQSVRTVAGYHALAQPHFDEVTQSVRHDFLHFPWTVLVLECRKVGES